MPSAPKLFIHNSVIMVTSRMEEGLPMVPTEFMNEIIWSVLAAAQARYRIEIIAFVFQANHFHLLLRVIDPEAVALFTGYVKQEISHRVNRLLGKRKHTLWCEGYDSPVVLDYEKFQRELGYVLLNPVKDHLTESMQEYPGVSSYHMFISERFSRRTFRIARDQVPALRNPERPWVENASMMQHFKPLPQQSSEDVTAVVVSPYGWKRCFPETAEMSDAEIRVVMLKILEQEQERILIERREKKIATFVRRMDLVRQSMVRHYIPEKFGRSMWCHSSSLSLRRAFIAFAKALIKQAAYVKEAWAKGKFEIPFPPGLYPPGRRPMASLLAWG